MRDRLSSLHLARSVLRDLRQDDPAWDLRHGHHLTAVECMALASDNEWRWVRLGGWR